MKMWSVVGFFLMSGLAVLLFLKGVDLKNTIVDGDGIGIHFLMFEVNDRVPTSEIPYYTKSFFTASGITAVFAIAALALPFFTSKRSSQSA
ncbi:hypothetical protein [Pseudalkalibacillus sp. SCS-8]|uniref:hypothetical protein n=1 Tax=Pseudalkalibacillus nanhaiensis TaxID=3115291 RepID=UPI0032DA8AC6